MAKIGISHRKRMEVCLSGEILDRPPVSLWRHFPVDDQEPGLLAKATINFQKLYDFDFVKVTPSSSYCLMDWGSEDIWRGSTEGTREYTNRVVTDPSDWSKLSVINPLNGNLKNQIDCLKLIVDHLGPETPVIQTIFNPLSQAKNLAGQERLLVHIRKYPDAVREGLDTIAKSVSLFIEEAISTGISGVFFAVQHAQFGLLSEDEFSLYGEAFDLKAIEPANDLWLNILHLHGSNIMFQQILNYPVSVVNWHDQDTYPTLAEGKSLFPGTVCGGLKREETIVLGTSEDVTNEARQAIEMTNGKRFILGTGCVTPITAPHGNLMAARTIVDG